MAFYTFIADYMGGTYVSQVAASDPESAVLAWASNLEVEAVYGLGAKSKQGLLKELQREAADIGCVPLDGLVNAWCVTLLVRGKIMAVNFVKTDINF